MPDRVVLESPFPPEEFAARLAAVQADLAARSLDAGLLADPEAIFWLSGYRSMGYFTFQALLVLPAGPPVLISRVVNRALGLATPTLAGFRAIGDSDDPVDVLVDELRRRLPEGGALGVETEQRALSAAAVRALERRAPFRIEDWNGVTEPFRRRKTPLQLDYMRRAARAACKGLEAAVAAVRPGRARTTSRRTCSPPRRAPAAISFAFPSSSPVPPPRSASRPGSGGRSWPAMSCCWRRRRR